MDRCKLKITALLLITAFDSIANGMIVALASPYLTHMGTTHFKLGIFVASTKLCQLLSGPIEKRTSSVHGKKFSLFLGLHLTLLSHFLLFICGNYWLLLINRMFFSCFYQTNNLCKALLLKIPQNDCVDFNSVQPHLFRVFGVVFGPILGGYLFYFDNGFFLIAGLAAALTLTNIFLMLRLHTQQFDMELEIPENKLTEELTERIEVTADNFQNCEPRKNWDVIMINFLFTASTTIFFSKFTTILRHHHQANSIEVGFTAAYQNFLMLSFTYFSDLLKELYASDVCALFTFDYYCLVMLAGSLIVICYVPMYEIYILACIPMIFANSFIKETRLEMLSSRRNEFLNELVFPIELLAGTTVPILFGLCFPYMKYYTVIIYTITPIIACIFIIFKNDVTQMCYDEYKED